MQTEYERNPFASRRDQRHFHCRAARKGTAVVEVAVTLPLVVMLALATIDTCQVLYLKQSAKIAAYEGARTALIPGATNEDIESQSAAILDARQVRGFAIDSPNIASTIDGDRFPVTVSVPADQNALVSSWFYRGKVFTEQAVIMFER